MSDLLNYKLTQVDNEKGILVFVHGLLGAGQNWTQVISHFSRQRWTCLSMDLRGHGKSFHSKEGDYTLESMALDIFDLIKSLNFETGSKVHLVGHSLGARIAMVAGALRPSFFESIVLEDLGPEPVVAVTSRTIKWLESVPVPFMSRSEAKSFFKNDFRQLNPEISETSPLGSFFYMNLKEFSTDKNRPTQYSWRFDYEGAISHLKLGLNKDFWKIYNLIESPIAIIRGENSDHLTEEVLEKMKLKQGVKSYIVSDAGHWVHFENLDGFNKALEAFFESL